MNFDGKGAISKYAGVAGVALAVVSGLLQVSGVTGSVVLAAALCALLLVIFGLYALFVRARPGRPKRLSLDQILTKYGKDRTSIDCVFSAGDQLRHFFDARAHDPRTAVLSPGTKVRLVTRHRSDGEELHVSTNMERLEERIQALGSSFDSKTAEWDNFMLGGALFDDDYAAVKFYHRAGGRTAAVGEGFLVVDRRRGGYESELFNAMRVAFECLWASASSGAPTSNGAPL